MINIYDWFGYDLPIKERYRLIKEAGFDGVLLWWSELLDRGDYRNGPQIAREAGLFVENIHTPFQVQDGIWSDTLDGEATMDTYLQCVEDCATFEIPTMVVHLPNDDKPYNALGLDRIKNIAEKAEQFGVNVALENLQNLTNLTYMLEQVDSSRIGFCYDSSHHHHFYPDKDFLSMYSSRLMAIHLHDFDEVDGKYNSTHRLPFDGMTDWPETMKRIAKTGYSGATAIEVMNFGYEDLSAKEFLDKAFKVASKLDALKP